MFSSFIFIIYVRALEQNNENKLLNLDFKIWAFTMSVQAKVLYFKTLYKNRLFETDIF